MLFHRRFVGLSVALLAACGGDAGPAAIPAATPAPSAPAARACDVVPGATPAPITDQSGPYYHQVAIARTPDGTSIRDPRQVLDHASVPDGVKMPDGSLRIYYVNGAEGSVWVARVDGDAVTPIGPISMNGVSRPGGIVDPDASALPDGRVRLVYLSGFGSPSSTSGRAMCLADSTDGEHFTVVGPALALSDNNSTDPSLARLSDGSWLMAYSHGQETILARSADGLSFTAGETLSYGGVPELAALADGRVRLYICARGIESYVSADLGRSWQREGVMVPAATLGKTIVCDPSLVAGTDVFVFKTAN